MTLSGEFTAVADYSLPLPIETVPGKFTVEPSSKKAIMLTLPVQKIQASMALNPDCPTICAFDGKSETCLATAKPPKTGDLVVVQLLKPLEKVEKLALTIGDALAETPDDEEDKLPGQAVLEISTDGTTFKAAGKLTESYQLIDIKRQPITAFRIRFTSDWTAPFCLAEVEPQMAGNHDDGEEDANEDDEAEDMNAGDDNDNNADADEDGE